MNSLCKKLFKFYIILKFCFWGLVILVNPLAVRILCGLWAGGVPIFRVSPPSRRVQAVASRPVPGGHAAAYWLVCTPVQREPHSATVLILNINT